jgi:hypothetical protein
MKDIIDQQIFIFMKIFELNWCNLSRVSNGITTKGRIEC